MEGASGAVVVGSGVEVSVHSLAEQNYSILFP